MHQEIRLHGHINGSIEYFVTAASWDIYRNYFYETTPNSLRLFSPGNELSLTDSGLVHRGNGGTFCEYMFGVDQPLPDLAKGNVRNRLVMYGASFKGDGSLSFSNQTEGSHTYERIFFEGNAVDNYFFFITGSVSGPPREQQEGIVRLLGKLLKRSPFAGQRDDTALTDELFNFLGHKSTLYLVHLINKKHKTYHDAFQKAYFKNKSIPDEQFAQLQSLAKSLDIDRYQQERIRIDVMYKHPSNRKIVDEYKNILINCHHKGHINKLENARLTRLKTLSVRNKIPVALFYTLDEMLKHGKKVDLEEQDYISETRQILQGIFFHESQIDAGINCEDMIKLLHAKCHASENRDHTFEQILLETGKACDEKIRDGADISLLENFSYIITYFDRYDNAAALINKQAFMEQVLLSEEEIRSLLGNQKSFEDLRKGLFGHLLFSHIKENKYLGQFGRQRIQILQTGLQKIEDRSYSIQDLMIKMVEIDHTEKLYNTLLANVKDRIRNFYSRYNTSVEQDALRLEIAEELQKKNLLEGPIPKALFRDVVVNIKKEAIYLHNLLPQIIAEQNTALREDFLDNSGLDRFYVEELEREYFELNNLNMDNLYQIRKGLNV